MMLRPMTYHATNKRYSRHESSHIEPPLHDDYRRLRLIVSALYLRLLSPAEFGPSVRSDEDRDIFLEHQSSETDLRVPRDQERLLKYGEKTLQAA